METGTTRDLLVRHVFLTCENHLNHSRLLVESMDRIEQQYIMLNQQEIRKNPIYRELLIKRCIYLGIDVSKIETK